MKGILMYILIDIYMCSIVFYFPISFCFSSFNCGYVEDKTIPKHNATGLVLFFLFYLYIVKLFDFFWFCNRQRSIWCILSGVFPTVEILDTPLISDCASIDCIKWSVGTRKISILKYDIEVQASCSKRVSSS